MERLAVGPVPFLEASLQGCGYTGFQGFQFECDVDPYDLAARRGPNGEHPLFMAGLSVARPLPFGKPEDVKAEVDYFMDFTDGGKKLF